MSKIINPKTKFQQIDIEQENIIFSNVSQIIEKRKFHAVSAANTQVILMFWEIGNYINSAILGMERAEYGKKILSTVSTKLVENYGRSFVEASRNQIELLELDKAGIAVAEYWTNLPPKNLLEKKINEILAESKERLSRRKLLPNTTYDKTVNYFIDYDEVDDI